MPFPANRLSAQPIDPEIAGAVMKAEILHEIKNVCEVLTLAGLRENPYPMVNPHQERRWQHAARHEIIGFVRKHYGKHAASEAARFKLFTLH